MRIPVITVKTRNGYRGDVSGVHHVSSFYVAEGAEYDEVALIAVSGIDSLEKRLVVDTIIEEMEHDEISFHDLVKWFNSMGSDQKNTGKNKFVVSDVIFDDEAEYIRDHGGAVIFFSAFADPNVTDRKNSDLCGLDITVEYNPETPEDLLDRCLRESIYTLVDKQFTEEKE